MGVHEGVKDVLRSRVCSIPRTMNEYTSGRDRKQGMTRKTTHRHRRHAIVL